MIELIETIQQLNPDKSYQLLFSDNEPNKTTDQNAYLWGVVYEVIADYTGHTKAELHRIFKKKFNLKTRFNNSGEFVELGGSTKKFNIRQLSRFIEQIIMWANEWGIYIPPANSVPDELKLKMLQYE